MIIGAQLYTLRDYCKTTADLAETLKKVADMGITTVQLSGVCGYEADWMAEQLKADGLTADITHFAYDRIIKDPEGTSAFHRTMGCRYIGIGGMPQNYTAPYSAEKLDAFFSEIRASVKIFAANGQKFMYHNHNREFAVIDRADGRTVLERICDAFPENEVGITVDTFWVQYAGEDPIKWLHRLKGRTDCVHFKDLSHDDSGNISMVPNGDGTMDYDGIIRACEDTGVRFGYIEQDNCNGEDPFACMKKSFAFFRSRGLK